MPTRSTASQTNQNSTMARPWAYMATIEPMKIYASGYGFHDHPPKARTQPKTPVPMTRAARRIARSFQVAQRTRTSPEAALDFFHCVHPQTAATMMTTCREALPPRPAETLAEKSRMDPRICTGQERMFRRSASTTVARAQMLPNRSEYGTGLPSSSNAGVFNQANRSIAGSLQVWAAVISRPGSVSGCGRRRGCAVR